MEQLEFKIFGLNPELILKEEKRRVLVSPDDSLMGETNSSKTTVFNYLISDYSVLPKTHKKILNERPTDDILKELFRVIYLVRIFNLNDSAFEKKLRLRRSQLKQQLKDRKFESPDCETSMPYSTGTENLLSDKLMAELGMKHSRYTPSVNLGLCRRCNLGNVRLITFSEKAVQNYYEVTLKNTGVGKIIKSEPRCDYCY